MKLYRGPRTGSEWTETDQKSLVEWATDWFPGKVLTLDGTIDKQGRRHTDNGVSFEPEEVLALFNGMLRHYMRAVEEGQKRRDEQYQEMLQIREAISAICNLIDFHSKDAPSPAELTSAVRAIAQHVRWGNHVGEAFPDIPWLPKGND